jgi:hypothetical protein
VGFEAVTSAEFGVNFDEFVDVVRQLHHQDLRLC